jgi:hypothetical protein
MRRSLLCFSVLLATAAVAQTQHIPRALAGHWHYSHDQQHGRNVVRSAIEPMIRQLPEMVQGMARDRLAERARVADRIEIVLEGERARVTYIGEHRMVVDSGLGETTTVRNAEGQDVRVTQRLQGAWLEQVFHGEHGEMRLLLSTERDRNTLHVDTTIAGERLATPIRWRLDYLRDAPAH